MSPGLVALVRELEDWKERAQAAEARVAVLERKLRGERERNDPRAKLARAIDREKRSRRKRKYTDE